MLIPKQIVSLGKIVPKHSSRYALTAVRIERHNGQPRALATDGHRAIVFSWDEPDAGDYPPIEGVSSKAVADFAANIPSQVLADAVKGISKRTIKPVLGFVLLDESDSQNIHLASTDLERTTRAQAMADEMTFPAVDSVIPQPGTDSVIYDPKLHGELAFSHVRIAVNASLMVGLLTSLAGLVGEGSECHVTLTVPTSPTKPIRLDAHTYDRRATGVIMPVAMAGDVPVRQAQEGTATAPPVETDAPAATEEAVSAETAAAA